MLDDNNRWWTIAKFGNQLKCGIGVVVVVIRQFLALNLLGLCDASDVRPDRHIQGRTLVRVFAIAQLGHAVTIDRKHVRKQLLLVSKGEPLADHAVISRGRRIGLRCAFATEIIACLAIAFLKLGN